MAEVRIALVPSAFAPMTGGVEELTAKLAAALVATGDDVEIWSSVPDEHGQFGISTCDGIVVRRVPMPLPPARARAAVSALPQAVVALRELGMAVKEFQPDVLHVQCFSNNGAYATALSARHRLPLVVSLQGETFMDDSDIYGRSAQLRSWLRAGIRRASFVTGCSDFVLRDAERFGRRSSKWCVIYNGVDLRETDAPTSSPIGGRYVLGLGRVVWNKGFDLLVSAFAASGCASDVDLVIAGDGPALREVQRAAAREGISERTRFVGRADRPDVAALMAGAEVVVVPSRVEPFGIVVLEAWRAGRPTITSNRGGIPEYVTPGEDTILVDPLDTVQFAVVLEALLGDRVQQQRLADGGRRSVAAFDWNAVAAEYRDLYRRAT